MTTHVLPSDTLISSLSLADGDTIEMNGHNLVMDIITCGSSDTNDLDIGLTITNSGADCNLEFKDLSGIRLNASLPPTVHPYVDPAHPLPVQDPNHAIDGDAYRTPLTANARAEIQLASGIALGGGIANLPTESRSGAFWANLVSSPDSTTLKFDRSIELHPGDFLVCLSSYNTFQKIRVVSWDTSTYTATLASNASRRTSGDLWAVLAGGVCVKLLGTPVSNIVNNVKAGTILLLGFSDIGQFYCGTTRLTAKFFGCSLTNIVYSSATNESSSVLVDRCVCNSIVSPDNNWPAILVNFLANEIATNSICHNKNPYVNTGRIYLGGGSFGEVNANWIFFSALENAGVSLHMKNIAVKALNTRGFANIKSAFRVENVSHASLPSGDCQVESSGTVTRTARTSFPVDTDLPDAQYHAPNAATTVTWRYEDRWVRKGAVLRILSRWMPSAAGSKASAAVTKLSAWWPIIWQLGAEVLAKTEFVSGLEQLKWHSGSLTWRNDTWEDCQVRVWECVTGDTMGGYLRVWEATGGPM